MTKPPPPPDEDYTAEERRLIDWRYQRFRECGVPHEDAMNLAARFDVPYQTLRDLVEDGCDVETALRIVA